MFRRLSIAHCAAAVATACGCLAQASGSEAVDWSSGVALSKTLAAPLRISWENTSVAHALSSLGQAQRVAILRDRRVDPEQPLALAIEDQPLGEAFSTIAARLNLGYAQLGPVAYLGPPQTAARLRTLAATRLEEVARRPAPAKRKFLLVKKWHWNRLSEPRALIDELAREAGVAIAPLDKIPHDLWPEADLPAMTWIDRLTLVAAQFDLTFAIDEAGNAVRLIDMPAEPVLVRSYLGGGNAAALATKFAREVPAARIDVSGTRIRVAARLEGHETIERQLRGRPARRTRVVAGREEYQLSVENAALDKVVAQLASQLKLEFTWDEAAIAERNIAVDQLVSVKIAGADLDKLLEAVFAGTGLAAQRDGRAIVIRPK
jgi:hypothetical protein